MTFDTARVVAFTILAATLAIVVNVWTRRRRAAKEDELRRQASMRGWTFESASEGAMRVHRWRGTTEGIAWVAESLEGPARQKGGRSHRRGPSRWRTTGTAGPASPIVCIGVAPGHEQPAFEVARGEGWLAALAQKAAGFAFDKSLDAYFGAEIGAQVDATALRRVEGTTVPGFVVMAADPDAAARLLFQRLQGLLGEAVKDRDAALSDEARPWVLLYPHGVALARMDRFSSAQDVERFVRPGVTLARTPDIGAPR